MELSNSLQQGCLFGLAVQCANARLSTQSGLISYTEMGTSPARGAIIKSGAYVIGLISWAASEGSTVSSLICDRWLTRKLATLMGTTDSLECRFSWHDRRSVAAVGLDLRQTCEEGRSLALAARGWTLIQEMKGIGSWNSAGRKPMTRWDLWPH